MLIIIVHPSIQRCKCVWAFPCEQLWIVGTVCIHKVIPHVYICLYIWGYSPVILLLNGISGKVNLYLSSVWLLVLAFSIFHSHKFKMRKMCCPLTILMCKLAVKLFMMSVSCSLYSMLEKVFHWFYCLWGASTFFSLSAFAFSSHFALLLVTVIQFLTMVETI